jgi:hypothetical protein
MLSRDKRGLLTLEHRGNYVLFSFMHQEGKAVMFRSVIEEAMALASITLFLAMVAVWAQVIGVL